MGIRKTRNPCCRVVPFFCISRLGVVGSFPLLSTFQTLGLCIMHVCFCMIRYGSISCVFEEENQPVRGYRLPIKSITLS